jgi:hypothetical protein
LAGVWGGELVRDRVTFCLGLMRRSMGTALICAVVRGAPEILLGGPTLRRLIPIVRVDSLGAVDAVRNRPSMENEGVTAAM